MSEGRWTAIDDAVVELLNHGQVYRPAEALISLNIDLKRGRRRSERAYARIWQWSRKRVRSFIRLVGAHPTEEPPDTYWMTLPGSQQGSQKWAIRVPVKVTKTGGLGRVEGPSSAPAADPQLGDREKRERKHKRGRQVAPVGCPGKRLKMSLK